MHDMSWYFDRGIEKGALLLDGANLNKNAFPLFSAYSQELRLIALGEGEELGYSYPGGKNRLRTLIAEHESVLEHHQFQKEDVIVNAGGCSGTFDNIFRIIKSESGSSGRDEIIIPIPFYPEIAKSALFNGLKPVYVTTMRETAFQPNPQEVVEKVSGRTAAIFLTTPGNPACTYLPHDAVKGISDIARDLGSYLVFDSIFEESPGAGVSQNIFHAAGDYDKIIKIKGWSKDRPQLNDLRLGWSVCKNHAINEKLLLAAEVSDFSNSTIAERIAIVDMTLRTKMDRLSSGKAGTDETLATYISETLTYKGKILNGMNRAIGALKASPAIADVIMPDAGNVIFAMLNDTPKLGTTHDLFFYLLNRGNILVSPGCIFNAPKNQLWYRTTMSIEPDEFLENTNKVLKLLEDLI